MRKKEEYAAIPAGYIRYGDLFKVIFVIGGREHIMLISDSQLEKLEVKERFGPVNHIKIEH